MKRFLLIVSIFLLTTFIAQAQKGSAPADVSNNAQGPILRFYPNPATTVITFDFQKTFEKGYSIQVYNFLGRKMIEQNNIAGQTTVNLTDFNRGVYIYKLFDKTGKLVETGKFQVSK